jgi:hypothetical protein
LCTLSPSGWIKAEKLKRRASRASRFPAGEGVHTPNSFLARRFGPHGTAWARQIHRSRSGFFELGPRHVPRGQDAASAPVVPSGEDLFRAAVPIQYRWVAMRVFSHYSDLVRIFGQIPPYSGFLRVHLLPEFLHRPFVDLLQGLDGAQDRGITIGLEVAPQIHQWHAFERRQV